MCASAQGKLNSVPIPPRIAQQPGHWSIVGLLPEDHTFSKGMLFLLQPGTKCVIFDVDGAYAASFQNESCCSWEPEVLQCFSE
jgi:hypothetical protein